MDDDSCSKFITSLTKYLQSLCHSYVEFSNGVELVGHIYLHVDTGKKIDYVLNESVCKNGSNVVKFTSNSYHAQPVDKSQKTNPLKKAPDPPNPEGGRKRDDSDVIIVGSEAAKRRRSSSMSSSQAPQSHSTSSAAQSGGAGGGAPGAVPSSAGVFRHPRVPNPRMAAPSLPGPRPGPFQYQARKRMPPPQQQPRGYLPMGASGYNPRARQPMYQPHGAPPLGGRGTFPVPSDIASIRGEYPSASGHPGLGGEKTGSSRFQPPFHPRQSVPLALQQQQQQHQQGHQQGHHAPLSMGSGAQPRPPHLLTTMGSGAQPRPPHLLTTMGSHLPTSMAPHLQSRMGPPPMGPQGLLQPALRPPGHGHRFLPSFPLGSHGQRQAPSMSLPVTTQLTTTSQPMSTSNPTASVAPPPPPPTTTTTAAVPPARTATPTTSAPPPPAGMVMIKGRAVPIPASLASMAQSKTPSQEGGLTKPQVSSGSSGPSSCLHQPSGSSGVNVKPVITPNMSVSGAGSQSQGMEASKSSSSSSATSDPLAASLSGVPTMTGISPKGRPSTPALEQCAAKKGLLPRGSGSHFPFPPTSSSSGQSFLPGGASDPPFAPSIQTFATVPSTTQPSSSVLDHSASKPGLSPRVNTSAGYFRYPGASESSQPSLSGGAGAHPLSSLSINIPPLMPSSSANHSHPSPGSSLYSPRAGGSNPFSSLSGMDLSQPPGGSSFHSPRGGGERSHPFRDITNSSLAHHPVSGGNFHSPRAGDRSHPYMGSSNISHSSYNGGGQLSPRVGNGSHPFMGSSGMAHSTASGSNLHSPRAANGSFPYMGSSSVSHESSPSDSNLFSPRGGYGSVPYVGSNSSSHASVGDSNLHSPRASDRSHPYMGSSNVSHPSVTESSLRFPRDYPSYSDMGSVKLSHPPGSGGHLGSPRVSDRSLHTSGTSSENSDRNLFSSLAGNSLPYSSGGTGNASYSSSSSLTNNDPFSSVGGSNFPFSSLGDSDHPYPPTGGGEGSSSYPPVQNGRLPFPPHSGSSLPYPTFGDTNLPFSSVSGSNLPGSSSLSDLPADQSVSSQLNQVRQTESMFDMFNAPAQQTDPLEARFNARAQTDSLEGRFNPPSQTDPLEARFNQLPEAESLTAKSQAGAGLDPSSSFPLNLSHPAPFSLDQAPNDRDGYSELLSELQALNQPPLNQEPTSPGSSLPREPRGIPNPSGMNLPEEDYPERDGQGEALVNAQPRTYEGEGHEDPRMPDGDDGDDGGGGRMSDEHDSGDNTETTTSSACQTSSQTDPPQTFLAPYEISGPAAGAQQGGGEEFRKRSGSLSSHSHETPSPSPGSVAGTETVTAETKPQGQQASDYDSGCDSGSTSTGERLSSPQGQAQASSTSHPQLKSLTIPLVPVDSPKSTSGRAPVKQEHPLSGEGKPAEEEKEPPTPTPAAEWSKEVDPDWADDMAGLNNSDSTESYSEGDDPDYVPENPRSTKGSAKRTRNKKSERGTRGKKRKVDSEEKGIDKVQNHPEKTATQAEGNGSKELPPHDQDAGESELRKEIDRYDPGMFLLLDTPSETDRMGRIKSSHTPAEVITTPEGESEGLWVHTLVPAGHSLWRLPPDDHKCQSQVDPAQILRVLYKVTVKIVAGKVLYKFDDMKADR